MGVLILHWGADVPSHDLLAHTCMQVQSSNHNALNTTQYQQELPGQEYRPCKPLLRYYCARLYCVQLYVCNCMCAVVCVQLCAVVYVRLYCVQLYTTVCGCMPLTSRPPERSPSAYWVKRAYSRHPLPTLLLTQPGHPASAIVSFARVLRQMLL